MFDRLGHLTYRRRRWVLALAGLFLVFGAVWGTGVFGVDGLQRLRRPRAASRPGRWPASRTPSGATRPTSSCSTATAAARSTTRPSGPPSRSTSPTCPTDLVDGTTTVWTAGRTAARARLRRRHGRPTPSCSSSATDDDALMDGVRGRSSRSCATAPPGLTVRLGGNEAIASDITTQVSEDIARAESALAADPAGAARRHLRRPDRGQPAAGDRRPGDPRRRSPCCGCSRWSPTSRSSPSTS